jgi:uncharacterized protein YgiM (DUF1202 family)
MKRAALLLLFLAACKGQHTVTDSGTMELREPIAVKYVGAPELPVRSSASNDAPILATYQNGEAISILADKGEWVEVRTGDRAGWARAADLTDAAGATEQEENPEAKFRVMPMPVSAPSARGEIYIEADVNTDGEITATRLITNTTGSQALAAQNTAALKTAKLHPIVQKGKRVPFKYYHRVTY